MKNYRFRCDAYGPDFFPRYYPDESVSLVQPPGYDDTKRPVFFTGHIDLANELLRYMPVRYLAITMQKSEGGKPPTHRDLLVTTARLRDPLINGQHLGRTKSKRPPCGGLFVMNSVGQMWPSDMIAWLFQAASDIVGIQTRRAARGRAERALMIAVDLAPSDEVEFAVGQGDGIRLGLVRVAVGHFFTPMFLMSTALIGSDTLAEGRSRDCVGSHGKYG